MVIDGVCLYLFVYQDGYDMLTKCQTEHIIGISRKDVLEDLEYSIHMYLNRRILGPLESVLWIGLVEATYSSAAYDYAD